MINRAIAPSTTFHRWRALQPATRPVNAYNFALQSPDRVRHLIQMGSPAGPTILGIPAIFRLLSLPIPVFLLKKALLPTVAKARDMFAEIGHKAAIDAGTIPDMVFEWYSALLANTNTMQHLVREVRAVATPFGYRSVGRIDDGALASLTVPTLYLWGDNDPFANPELADALCALTPGATIEHFEGFGHTLWYDDPPAIAERVRAFFSKA